MPSSLQPTNRHRQFEGLDTAAKCWRLTIDGGMTQRQVAGELGITPAGVSRALRRIESLALESLKSTISAHKIKTLDRYELQYFDARAAWEQSRNGSTRKRSKQKEAGDATERTSEVVTEDSPGDPRFLMAAMAALAGIRKLLGLDAPIKVAMVDEQRPLKHLTDDELNAEMAAALKLAGVDPMILLRQSPSTSN